MSTLENSEENQPPKPFSWISVIPVAAFLLGLLAVGNIIVERLTPAKSHEDGQGALKHELLCFVISATVHGILQVAGLLTYAFIAIYPKIERMDVDVVEETSEKIEK